MTVQRCQDAHAKQQIYSAPLLVTEEEVQTKNAHYLVTCAQNAQMLLKADGCAFFV
jgi:hypothetical protein